MAAIKFTHLGVENDYHTVEGPPDEIPTVDIKLHKKARRIAYLLAGYMRETLTPCEHDELDEWVGASDKNMKLFEELTDERRVQLALELLNDNNQTALTKRLRNDGFNYRKSLSFRIKNAWYTLLSYLNL